jgi:hypothetical protein
MIIYSWSTSQLIPTLKAVHDSGEEFFYKVQEGIESLGGDPMSPSPWDNDSLVRMSWCKELGFQFGFLVPGVGSWR